MGIIQRAVSMARAAGGARRFGWKREPFDPRDQLIGAVGLPDAPPAEHLPRHGLRPLYQRGNSCTGRVVHGVRISLKNQGRDPGELSGQFNYNLSRYLAFGADGLDFDGGSYVREACRALVKYGAPLSSLFPESWQNVARFPTAAAQRNAYKLSGVRGYFRVPMHDLNMIRRVIASGHTVGAGWNVDEAFASGSGSNVRGPMKGPIIGAHFVVLDGYTRDGRFHSPASWEGWHGTEYVEAGGWFTEELVAQGADGWAFIFNDRGPNA
jgi:hypothetical protein